MRYEYRRDDIHEDEWEEECNRLGAEGWRLFKMQQKWVETPSPLICYFIREVSGAPVAPDVSA
jgi:hypothetical protein